MIVMSENSDDCEHSDVKTVMIVMSDVKTVMIVKTVMSVKTVMIVMTDK